MTVDRRGFLRGCAAIAGIGVSGCSWWRPSAPHGTATPVSTSAPPSAPVAREGAAEPLGNSRWAGLNGFCSDIDPPANDEFEARRDRCRRIASDHGFQAIATEAGVAMTYLTGARWGLSERPLLYVLPVDGDPVWIGPHFEEGTLRGAFVGNDELMVWHEHESPYERLLEALAARGVDSGRVALDGAMRLFVVEGLRRTATRLSFVSGAAVLDACRVIKSESELARLRRANEATKAALSLVARHVGEGMTEAEVAAMVRAAQEAAGLTQVWALVAFGENAAFPHGGGDGRPLRSGELVLVDTGGSLHGYRSDITRTWPIGSPTKAQEKAWNAVLAAQTAALERIRPNATCAEPDAVARITLDKLGYGTDYEHFTHRLGHGIGLEVHEPPYLVRNNATRLDTGMTMSVEPGLYLRGRLGVRLEDIIAVADDGIEVFGPRAESLENPFGIA